MSTTNTELAQWVNSVAEQTSPDNIVWCTGSDDEYQSLIDQMQANGTLQELNQEAYPNCFLHRSDPTDVARVEHLTYVCSSDEEDAGPNNNWMAPDEAKAKMNALFDGCMKGRTLYVVPYCMGPIDSSYSRLGVEITICLLSDWKALRAIHTILPLPFLLPVVKPI